MLKGNVGYHGLPSVENANCLAVTLIHQHQYFLDMQQVKSESMICMPFPGERLGSSHTFN